MEILFQYHKLLNIKVAFYLEIKISLVSTDKQVDLVEVVSDQ